MSALHIHPGLCGTRVKRVYPAWAASPEYVVRGTIVAVFLSGSAKGYGGQIIVASVELDSGRFLSCALKELEVDR